MTDTTVALPQYMTVAEVAEDLRVAPMTVYRMIARGHLLAIRLGHRTFRIPTADYHAYKRTLHVQAEARAGRTEAAPIPGQTELPA